MSSFHHFLPLMIHFMQARAIWAYTALFIGIVLEGDITMILAGMLMHVGVLDPSITILVSYAGAASKTTIFYSIGRVLNKFYPKSRFFKFAAGHVMHFLPNFKEKPFKSIFISKFIYIFGVNHFAIMYSAYTKISLRKFIEAEFASSLIWVAVMLGLGYYFSSIALQVTKNFWAFLGLFAFLLIGIMLLYKLGAIIYEYIIDKPVN